MNRFEFVTARSVESAVDLVKNGGRFYGGGVDVLGELKDSIGETKRLVNVKSLPDTHEVKKASDALYVIGANVTVAEIAAHPELAKLFPGLVEAATEVGSPQIRNVATLGGNLAQHSRCWYYRHRDIECLKKGGATCYAREGENKYHALFSGNPCISPVVSNLAIALAALNGKAIVQRGKNLVTLSMNELYRDAWTNPLAHHSLGPADLILGVELGIVADTRSAYMQVSEKSEFDWALVSCSAAAQMSGNTAKNVRIALGQISPIPHEVEAANAFLEGKTLDEKNVAAAADLVQATRER